MVGDQLRVKAGGKGEDAEEDEGGGFGFGGGRTMRTATGGGRIRRRELSEVAEKGGGVEERKEGCKVRLKEVDGGLPRLQGEDRRVQGLDMGLGGVLRGGHTNGPARPLPLGTVPFRIAILPVGHGADVSFRSTAASANGRCGIDTFAAGGLARATSRVNTGVDAFDLAPAAAGAGNARPHVC